MDDDYSLQDDDFFIMEEFIFPEDGGITGEFDHGSGGGSSGGDRSSGGLTCSVVILLCAGIVVAFSFLLCWNDQAGS